LQTKVQLGAVTVAPKQSADSEQSSHRWQTTLRSEIDSFAGRQTLGWEDFRGKLSHAADFIACFDRPADVSIDPPMFRSPPYA